MPDTDHLFRHISRAREACDRLETHIIDYFPAPRDDNERVEFLELLAEVRGELKDMHYTVIPWSS